MCRAPRAVTVAFPFKRFSMSSALSTPTSSPLSYGLTGAPTTPPPRYYSPTSPSYSPMMVSPHTLPKSTVRRTLSLDSLAESWPPMLSTPVKMEEGDDSPSSPAWSFPSTPESTGFEFPRLPSPGLEEQPDVIFLYEVIDLTG